MNKNPITIQVLNPVECVVMQKQGYRLTPVLSYNVEYWIQGRYRKERKASRKPLINKLSGKFPVGLLGRVREYCDEFGIPLTVQYAEFPIPVEIYWDGRELPFQLREYQLEALKAALDLKRGVIQAPTGSGKTFIMASIATYFPTSNITFIVHTKGLLLQTIKELQRFFPEEDIGQVGEGRRDYHTRISVAMIQTVHSDLKSQIPEKYKNAYVWTQKLGLVFVDECHHVNKLTGSYVNFLSKTMAPARFGVTATLPTSEEGQLALEGYIGRVIYTVKMDDLIEEGTLAVPKLKVMKAPDYPELRDHRAYKQVYDTGIVMNRSRNRLVLQEAERFVRDERSVLIIITRREHGEQLIRLSDRMFPGLKIIYIHGDTDGETRELVRTTFNKKLYDVVIATTIWKEGIDIPTLGAIINAAGGKSEIATIQTLGRGLRTAPGKDEIFFLDFFDNSHHYLIDHFGERLSLYFDLNWL
jgi:superfamily II DNA or RNA helicase